METIRHATVKLIYMLYAYILGHITSMEIREIKLSEKSHSGGEELGRCSGVCGLSTDYQSKGVL